MAVTKMVSNIHTNTLFLHFFNNIDKIVKEIKKFRFNFINSQSIFITSPLLTYDSTRTF